MTYPPNATSDAIPSAHSPLCPIPSAPKSSRPINGPYSDANQTGGSHSAHVAVPARVIRNQTWPRVAVNNIANSAKPVVARMMIESPPNHDAGASAINAPINEKQRQNVKRLPSNKIRKCAAVSRMNPSLRAGPPSPPSGK